MNAFRDDHATSSSSDEYDLLFAAVVALLFSPNAEAFGGPI